MVNTTAAIMAIPGPLEPIRLVGDEDKHATLLFFGETSTLPDTAKQTLIDSVKMASGMLFPFAESVVDVARLGSETPPALVAMLSGDNLTQVRNLFMMNPAVKSFLDNADQHDSFTPHVTLGHPDFVDEAVLRALMRQVYRVRFDRLSVWWNDERIEFSLDGSSQTSDGGDMAMSDAVENVLSHQAIKLGKKNGTKNHVLFIARGDKPSVGDQFSHQGVPHTVVSVKTSKGNDKRHMVTAKPTPKSEMKHFEWESYELDEFEESDSLGHHGIKGQKWGVRRFVDSATGRVEQTGRTGVVGKGSTDVKVSTSGKTKATGGTRSERRVLNKALKKGVVKADPKALLANEKSGLNPRTSSADQIHQDRIASKIAESGSKSVSNADIQAYTRRLQLQQDLDRALASQTVAVQKQADGFIKSFVKKQADRQTNRIINAAADIAVEQGLKQLGVKTAVSHPELGGAIKDVSTRIKPKKK